MTVMTINVNGAARTVDCDPATPLLWVLREQLGLNKPWFFNPANPLDAQYPKYITALVRGDLGTGLKSNIPVLDDLKARFPATAELSVAALLVALLKIGRAHV